MPKTILPLRVNCEGLAPRKYAYRYIGYRKPKKGEYFLKDRNPYAVKAKADYPVPAHVIEPIIN